MYTYPCHLSQQEKRAKEMAARREEMEQQAMRKSVSRQAYQRWAKEKQEEDAIMMKEKQKEKELLCLKAEERGEQRRRARESYQSWRRVKDEELKLQRHTADEPSSTLPFPSRGRHLVLRCLFPPEVGTSC